MFNQKLVSFISLIATTACPLIFMGCESSSSSTISANNPSLNTVAASAHSTFLTDPTIDITLTDSGDLISLVVDSVDPLTDTVTYIGTDDLGYPSNPADVQLGLAPEVTNFSFTLYTGGNTTYTLAVNTDTNEAYTIHYEVDGNETTAIVRTIAGTQLATATATGNWEFQYPATQGTNMTGLLAIVVLSADVPCTPNYQTARSDCRDQCGGATGVKNFEYSCDRTTGSFTVKCECDAES